MLTILNVASPFAPVGPDAIDGAQQVLSALDARIVREGHSSIVLAPAGSRAAGYLVTIPAHTGLIDDAARARVLGACRDAIARILRGHSIDVIHFHGADCFEYLPATDIPMIVTLHLPPARYPAAAFAASELYRVCSSQAQRRACPPDAAIGEVICSDLAAGRDPMTTRYLELYRERVRVTRRRRAPAPIDATMLTRDDELAALAVEWNALCDRCSSATPFQRPAWLLAWRRQFGAGGTPRTVALRRAGRLVGLVPLELRDGTLRLIGAGVSDYLDAILESDVEPARLAEFVRLAMTGARSVELEALRPTSPLLAIDLGTSRQVTSTAPSPVATLPSPRMPGRLAYERRRISRAGTIRLEREDGDPGALLEGLFACHPVRRTTRAHGISEGPALEQFHRDAAAGLHALGLLRMVGLYIDERLGGVLYGFADHGRHLVYLSGSAPELASWNPSRLMIAQALERATDEGAIELDFLRGREPYKYEWNALDRPLATYHARLEEDPCSGSAGP